MEIAAKGRTIIQYVLQAAAGENLKTPAAVSVFAADYKKVTKSYKK